MGQLHHRVTDEEYNALLQQFVSRPKSDPSHPIFDKMYYDYLPSEATASEVQPTDAEREAIDLTDFLNNKRKKPFKKVHHHAMEGEDEKQHHQGERRMKRAVAEHGHEIGKRQAGESNYDDRDNGVDDAPMITNGSSWHERPDLMVMKSRKTHDCCSYFSVDETQRLNRLIYLLRVTRC